MSRIFIKNFVTQNKKKALLGLIMSKKISKVYGYNIIFLTKNQIIIIKFLQSS